MQTIKNHSFLYRTISQESEVTLSTKKTFSLRIYVSIQISTKLQPTPNLESRIYNTTNLKKDQKQKEVPKKKKKNLTDPQLVNIYRYQPDQIPRPIERYLLFFSSTYHPRR